MRRRVPKLHARGLQHPCRGFGATAKQLCLPFARVRVAAVRDEQQPGIRVWRGWTDDCALAQTMLKRIVASHTSTTCLCLERIVWEAHMLSQAFCLQGCCLDAGYVVPASYDAGEAVRLAGYLQSNSASQKAAPLLCSTDDRPGFWCSAAHYLRSLMLHARTCELLSDASEALAALKEAAALVGACLACHVDSP